MAPNDGSADLMAMLRYAFGQHWDRPALWIAGGVHSYGQSWTAGSAIAETLVGKLAAHETVGILAQRTVSAYLGILGCVLANRPYVPINMKVPFERQLAMARAASCGAFISDPKSEARHRQLNAALGREDVRLFDGAAPELDAVGRGPALRDGTISDHNIAYVMFTSGTTGTPKGVAVTRANLLSYLRAVAQVAGFAPGSKCTQLFDLSFDLSVHDIFRTWAGGGCLFIMDDEETLDPVGFARRHDLDCWFSVPSAVPVAKRLNRLGAGSLPSLRLSLFCGEALPTSLATEWCQVAPNSRILNLYGPTEATIAITAHEYRAGAYEGLATVPLGAAFAGSSAVAIGEDGEPAKSDEEGELWLGGAQIANGYINDEAETGRRFVERRVEGFAYDRWYRTGDIVRADRKHGLIFLGRRDHQVKINGYRVELLDVEEALRFASQCSDVAAVAWPISENGAAEGVVGFVCGSKREPQEIIAACRTRLPSYMAPRRVLAVDSIPVNSNGKIDRPALLARYLQSPDEWDDEASRQALRTVRHPRVTRRLLD